MIRDHNYKRNPKRVRETVTTLRARLEKLERERAIEQSAVAAFNHVQARLGNIEESLAVLVKKSEVSYKSFKDFFWSKL